MKLIYWLSSVGGDKRQNNLTKKAGWFIATYIPFAPTVSELSGCLEAIQVTDSGICRYFVLNSKNLKKLLTPASSFVWKLFFSAFLACKSKLESGAWIGETNTFFSVAFIKSNVNGPNAQGEAKICSNVGAGLVYE